MTPEARAAGDPITPEAVHVGFTPGRVGQRILYFDSVGSTNSVLRQAAARGAPEGTVVLAEEQTTGRGRLNRTWESRPGVGVYLSLLLRPDLPQVRVHLYTFLPAVAATRALRAVSGLPIFIQWPNDILLRGRKVAGILSELRSLEGMPREIVIGVGINVNHTPADLSPAIRETATSLAIAAGRTYERAAVIRAFLAEMERGYAVLREEGSGALVAAWKRLSPSHYGKPVQVAGGSAGPIRGVTRGLDDEGALLVERSDGGLERVAFGDVRRVRGS